MTTTEVAHERRTAGVTPLAGAADWYKEAVIYELHVRAFHDGNGDGIGDFKGLIEKLDYLQGLGVTAIWLLPFYPSPLRDDGYDISDYRQVHPSYGTLRDFRLFLREAHRRGIRVITELVLAHTSDAHPWFQRARRAGPGSSHRNYYVWSDTPERYAEARVIFKDFESSNWSFDPVTGAYYWHRFYSHQPSLNYDNPAVRQSILDVVDFWLSMGVDGLRLDAVPYLYAREGTTCENLPETFDFLRQLRRHIDDRFEGRMLLAEANQWPEDAVRYMGKDGEICQMAFHFPLMPRMFMAARQEDRYPMVDILAEMPATPPDGQWALFLRNHDELTLEMVTDEERDYMYRAYAREPQARINVGIRRRLAPLLGNDRKLIEMMNGLLLSMPGTPIVYYGDEIGMGDNIYLGDRNAVRTPMQWNGDRNAGFSTANPQQLYLPVISDPQYHSQAVNVEAQSQNSSSLLWWMKRLIALRQRYKAFGLGSLEMLFPENRKVFAFIRQYGEERILCVFNLSRHAQCAELDLSSLRGAVPVELFGTQEFPPVGELPYFITLGPHGFYWFSLECDPEGSTQERLQFSTGSQWEAVFDGPNRRKLESWLPSYLAERRWFTQKTRSITSATILDTVPIPGSPGPAGPSTRKQASTVAHMLLVQVELDFGAPEYYLVPVAFLDGLEAEDMRKYHPDAVLADVRTDDTDGVLVDGVHAPRFVSAMTDALARRRVLPGRHGQLTGVPAPGLRRFEGCLRADCPNHVIAGEQSNSSVVLDEQAVVKFIRRFEEGINPAVEVGRFLSEQAHFPHAPRAGGSLEYRSRNNEIPSGTVAILEQFVPNEGDGWHYLVDTLAHGLEDALASNDLIPPERVADDALVGDEAMEGAFDHPFVGPHLEWASLLGRRTAELHVALTSTPENPDFAPEPLTMQDRVALFHGARSLARQVLRDVAAKNPPSRHVAQVLAREGEILQRLQRLSAGAPTAFRIRCHGDFHLGQVLWTGKDFTIIDFEGEPSRSLGWRRLKRPAAFDLAGMIRSLHYAGQAAALRTSLEFGRSVEEEMRERCDRWLDFWHRSVSSQFLDSYLEVARQSRYLPSSRSQVAELLDFFRLEKALYELSYEMNSRPTWVDIPARGILSILESDRVSLDPDLAALARHHGIAPAYQDVEGRSQEADTDVVVALLDALGVPLPSPDLAGKVLREQQEAANRRQLEPVLVQWIDRPSTLSATLPASVAYDDVWLSLELEDGEVRRAPLAAALSGGSPARPADPAGRVVHVPFDLKAVAGGALPAGRHHLTLEGAGAPETALLLAAPTAPASPRRLGAFMPVHAIRSAHDWGIGTYSDLERLGEWVSSCGVDLLGTLPLYPAFLAAPEADPSPYLPVSRLAYNEVFVDPVALAEFSSCRDARGRWATSERHVAALRSSTLVPYEQVARLLREVLEPMARSAADGRLPERQAGLRAFGHMHPELEAYARFRAAQERRGPDEAPDPTVTTYYLYCQWAAHEQLEAATKSCPHFADFPVGSHPRGFDPHWSPVSFVPGVHGGAPPDRFFPLGQDWGFRPLHPERLREDEYRFVSAALARAFRHAACVRLDHVMGLQRLFMIPEGASGGAYVSYAVEELHTLVALEAHRHGTVVVGEDLGTVPEEVRPRMERDRILRTWVFEFETTEACPLPDPPELSLAALATHDLPRFAAYLWGDDVSEREELGVITAAEAVTEQALRAVWREQLLRRLGLAEDYDVVTTTAAALEGCLIHLARGPATITVADLEDLWGERERQNVPGTGPEAKNWRRRSARTLEQLRRDDHVSGVLRALADARAS